MNVLIACEFSGVVREAFRARGHDAYSCDLLDADDGSPYHIHGDVRDVLNRGANLYTPRGYAWHRVDFWGLMIAHPPCTFLCNSGVRWLYTCGKGSVRDPARWAEMQKACDLFEDLLRGSSIPRIAIENPIMHGYAQERINLIPDQIIQPWQFGHGETKRICLWLKNLPPLTPTNIVAGRKPRVHHESPGPDRWKRRSITYHGIAKAMAEQWGNG
jgi:hypothetical protein